MRLCKSRVDSAALFLWEMRATIDRSFSNDKIYVRFSKVINNSIASEFIKYKWTEVTERIWSKSPCSILAYDEAHQICSSFKIDVDKYVAENEISIITNSVYDACEKMQIEIKSVPDHLYILFYKSKIETVIGKTEFVNNSQINGLVKKYPLPSREQFSQRHMNRYHSAYINAIADNKKKINLHYRLLSKWIKEIHTKQNEQLIVNHVKTNKNGSKFIININKNVEQPPTKIKTINHIETAETNKQSTQKHNQIFNEADPILKIDKRSGVRNELGFNDVLIRKSGITCPNGHIPIGITGIIPIITPSGHYSKIEIPISYCPVCKKYFISENIYKKKKDNIIICKISKSDKNLNANIDEFSNWNSQSLLMAYGYTVRGTSKLTVEQRRAILITLIKNDVLSKERILSYLNLFKRINNSEYARTCWESDIEYISKYNFKR